MSPPTSGELHRDGDAAALLRWDPDTAYRLRLRTVVEWLRPLPADATVLDAGAGRGYTLRLLRRLSSYRLVGLEIDPLALAVARTALEADPRTTLVQGSVLDLPFPSDHFDAVVTSEVIEHVDDDARALAEVARVLRPGGRAVITVPNLDFPFWWDPVNATLQALLGTHLRRGPLAGHWAHHVRLYRAPALRAVVAAAGLEVEDERALGHHCFPFQHNLVYGLGRPLLEKGFLPGSLHRTADRARLDRRADGSPWNPIRLAVRLFDRFARRDSSTGEPPGSKTVSLCLLARKPR